MLTIGMSIMHCVFFLFISLRICNRVVSCMSCNNFEDDQSLPMNETVPKDTTNSFSREYRIRRSLSGLEKLINNDG